MHPLVSVYITTHNRSEYLKKAVNSVLNQTYKNIEIIISDDGSKDDTADVVTNLMCEHSNIKYTRSEEPCGANYARNKAVSLAAGEFITGLDDDDLFTPERVGNFVKYWDDKYAFICDDFIDKYYDSDKPHYNKNKVITFTCEDLLFQNLASNQIFTLCARLKEIGGFNPKLKRLQDWDCWLRLTYTYGAAKRYDWCSYIMHHDQSIRISNSHNVSEAFSVLVSENIAIYKDYRGQLADKLISTNYSFNLLDLLKVRRVIEFKIILKKYILGFFKNS